MNFRDQKREADRAARRTTQSGKRDAVTQGSPDEEQFPSAWPDAPEPVAGAGAYLVAGVVMAGWKDTRPVAVGAASTGKARKPDAVLRAVSKASRVF